MSRSQLSRRAAYIHFAEDLYRRARKDGAPRSLASYNDLCNIDRDVGIASLGVDGCIYWVPEKHRYRIEINEKLPPTVRRFVWAHEIAHTFADIIDPTERRIQRLSENVSDAARRSDRLEQLCDEVAGLLLVPTELITPITRELAPSLRTVMWMAKEFDVSLTTAAIRYVAATSVNCLLVLWESEKNGAGVHPFFKLRSRDREWSVPIPVAPDEDCQPVMALRSGKLQEGRSWIDLGGGKECYYCESVPIRRRTSPAVMTLFVMEKHLPYLLQRPKSLPSDRERKLF